MRSLNYAAAERWEDTLSYQSPHVFIVRRRVQMNRSHLCPIEDAICQSMLHIAKARRFARPLQLRIVYHKLGLSSRAATEKIVVASSRPSATG
jgi:hypothetical protein